jgi:segregation and condensation protein B
METVMSENLEEIQQETESAEQQNEQNPRQKSPQQEENEIEQDDSARDAVDAQDDQAANDQQQQAGKKEQTDQPESEDREDRNVEVTIETIVEAILFASDEPLTPAKIANIVETTPKQIRDSIENLNQQYDDNNNAFRIEEVAGGFQMLTLSVYNTWLKKLLRTRSEGKLSPAALETLAIIAYKQPVIRADVETIRGVACGEVIRSLMYKGLIKIVGKAEVLGRPMLYGTTKKFLETFGLKTLKDLPKIEELKKPE